MQKKETNLEFTTDAKQKNKFTNDLALITNKLQFGAGLHLLCLKKKLLITAKLNKMTLGIIANDKPTNISLRTIHSRLPRSVQRFHQFES